MFFIKNFVGVNMAQVLKDELRKKIIIAAKNEFLKKGIANSSMREIAKKAETPVGNVYKYFKNKQDLVNTVLSPLLKKLDGYNIKLLSDKSFLNRETIDKFLFNWVDGIVELQSTFQAEMNIIVNDEQINCGYQKKLVELITDVVFITRQVTAENRESLQIISCIIAKSIFAGIREGVTLKCNSNIDKEEFRKIMHAYMRNAFFMLNNID